MDGRSPPISASNTTPITATGTRSTASLPPWTPSACVTRDLERWGEVQFDAVDLMEPTFALIEASDVAPIELSEKGVGLGIEAGYAFARGVPIVVLHETGRHVSTTMRGVAGAVLEYAEGTLDAVAELVLTLTRRGKHGSD